MSGASPFERSPTERLKSYFVTGAVFVVPAVVTVGIMLFVYLSVAGYLSPVANKLADLTGVSDTGADLLTMGLLLVSVVVIGAVLETLPYGSTAADLFHRAAEAIPGVGQVYGGFREMSETMANGEESFRDVKLSSPLAIVSLISRNPP